MQIVVLIYVFVVLLRTDVYSLILHHKSKLCYHAKICIHDGVKKCGGDKHSSYRWFLDSCDMKEYNCIHESSYVKTRYSNCDQNENSDFNQAPSTVAKNFLPEPCDVRDIVCLDKATEMFLDKTAAGVPELKIKPVDPIVVPSVHYKNPKQDLSIEFKNLKVVGLKNQKVHDFKINLKAHDVVLTTRVDLQISGVYTAFNNRGFKIANGIYRAIGTTLGTAEYSYTLKMKKGVEHFIVGPETISCDVAGAVNTTFIRNLPGKVGKLKDSWKNYVSNKSKIDKIVFCKIVKILYHNVVHNIRAIAKVLPTTDFFKNI